MDKPMAKVRVSGTAMPRSDLIRPELARRPRFSEKVIQAFLFLCGAISILTTLGIVYELGKEAWLFFGSPEVNLIEFLTQSTWQPSIGAFGVLPLVSATLMTTFFAMLVALPWA